MPSAAPETERFSAGAFGNLYFMGGEVMRVEGLRVQHLKSMDSLIKQLYQAQWVPHHLTNACTVSITFIGKHFALLYNNSNLTMPQQNPSEQREHAKPSGRMQDKALKEQP